MVAKMLGKQDAGDQEDDADGKVSKPTPLELAAEEHLRIMHDHSSPTHARDLAKSFKAMHDLCKD